MLEEEKQLLLQDLCARLPYGVKVQHQHQDYLNEVQTVEHISRKYGEIETESVLGFVDDFRPYLRPMESMTEEEKQVLELCDAFTEPRSIELKVDFYNKQHLDYRGLIEKGLALEAPDGIYQ